MPETENRGEPSLDDRYELERGEVFLTGTQALARLVIEQQRRDTCAGLRTKSFITGYPGSPLSGLDIILHGATSFSRNTTFAMSRRRTKNRRLAC